MLLPPCIELKEASTQKSAKTHIGNVFVTRDLDLLSSDIEINAFPGLIMEHFNVKFSNPSCIDI